MNLIYQWVPWAYSNLASLKAKEMLNIEIENLIDKPDFSSVWEVMDNENIWVLPVENSYAGNIHENLYSFLRYDYKIIWEIDLQINHCLLSKETELENAVSLDILRLRMKTKFIHSKENLKFKNQVTSLIK